MWILEAICCTTRKIWLMTVDRLSRISEGTHHLYPYTSSEASLREWELSASPSSFLSLILTERLVSLDFSVAPLPEASCSFGP